MYLLSVTLNCHWTEDILSDDRIMNSLGFKPLEAAEESQVEES